MPKDSRIYVARQTQEIYLDRNNNNIFLHILGQKFKVKPVFNNLSAANTFKHILGLSLTGGTEIYYGEVLLWRRYYYYGEDIIPVKMLKSRLTFNVTEQQQLSMNTRRYQYTIYIHAITWLTETKIRIKNVNFNFQHTELLQN